MRRWSQLVHPFSLKLDNLFSGPIPRCSLQTSIIYCIQTSSQILLETKSTTSSKITENAPKKPLNIVKDFEGRKTTSQFTQTKFYHYRLFSYTPTEEFKLKIEKFDIIKSPHLLKLSTATRQETKLPHKTYSGMKCSPPNYAARAILDTCRYTLLLAFLQRGFFMFHTQEQFCWANPLPQYKSNLWPNNNLSSSSLE